MRSTHGVHGGCADRDFPERAERVDELHTKGGKSAHDGDEGDLQAMNDKGTDTFVIICLGLASVIAIWMFT